MAQGSAEGRRCLGDVGHLEDFNATQAAIRAGYSAKTAKEIAAQNLAKLHIRERIMALDTLELWPEIPTRLGANRAGLGVQRCRR